MSRWARWRPGEGAMEREAVTRKRRIDPKLKAAGWTVTPYQATFASGPPPTAAVEEWPTTAGPADYALTDDDAIRAVVEAKKVTIGPQGVLTQAERYSRGVSEGPRIRGEFGVPFLYSTNGEQIHFHDVRREQNRSRIVSASHTPTALAEMLSCDVDAELAALKQIPVNQRLRPYQVEANQTVEEAIADGKRKMLVTMATGTGKTLTTVDRAYRLMKSGIARRAIPGGPARAGGSDRPRVRLVQGRAGPEVRQDLPGLLSSLQARGAGPETLAVSVVPLRRRPCPRTRS